MILHPLWEGRNSSRKRSQCKKFSKRPNSMQGWLPSSSQASSKGYNAPLSKCSFLIDVSEKQGEHRPTLKINKKFNKSLVLSDGIYSVEADIMQIHPERDTVKPHDLTLWSSHKILHISIHSTHWEKSSSLWMPFSLQWGTIMLCIESFCGKDKCKFCHW